MIFDLKNQAKIIKGSFQKMNSKVNYLIDNISRVDGILSTVFVMPWQGLVGHVANHLKIPVINWQHGGMNLQRDDHFVDSTEMNYTNHYFKFYIK